MVWSLAFQAQAQDTSVRVTYATRAERASVVIAELSRVTKVDLRPTPDTRDEILVIVARNQTLSSLMSRIATVTSGEWQHDGTAYCLVGSKSARQQEKARELFRNINIIRRDIQSRISDQRNVLTKATGRRRRTKPEEFEMEAGRTRADDVALAELLKG